MKTNNTTIPVEAITTSRRRRVYSMIAAGAATAIAITALGAAVHGRGDTGVKPAAPPSTSTDDDRLRDLANRGVIPRQAAPPAPMSRDELLRDLVSRGVIPRQTLDPAPTSTVVGG